MESWRFPATVTVGDGMCACQAMRQKLRIAYIYASEQRINLSAALSRHRLECTQDKTYIRSDLTVLNDSTNDIKMMCGK